MFVSGIISSITHFRNPNGSEYEWSKMPFMSRQSANPLKVALAEVGYIAAIPFAIVETALSAIATLFAFGVYCMSGDSSHRFFAAWLKISAFSIAWSCTNVLINPFCNDMIEYGVNAMKTASAGTIFQAPGQLEEVPYF